MLRHALYVVGLFVGSTIFGGGCRSCSDCHDYDPPVAGCECGGYGQRTGSVNCGGCGCGSCSTGGAPAPASGCGCGHCGGSSGYYESGVQANGIEQPVETVTEEFGN